MWKLRREEQLVILFLIGAFTVGFGIKMMGGIPQNIPPPPCQLIKIKIEGAVKNPGWYRIPRGSTLKDVLEKAGGTLPWADLSKIQLSQPLLEESEIHIPEGKMDLNSVSLEQLIFLPGIGPELAKRIINYRKEKGRFESLSDLKEVPGIGEARFEKIKDKLVIEKEVNK